MKIVGGSHKDYTLFCSHLLTLLAASAASPDLVDLFSAILSDDFIILCVTIHWKKDKKFNKKFFCIIEAIEGCSNPLWEDCMIEYK